MSSSASPFDNLRRGEHDAVISGVGQSVVGRRLGRDPLDLTVEATLAAIADAGLSCKDIDGIATYPGAQFQPPGFSGVGVSELQDALRLQLNWFVGGVEMPGQLGSLVLASLAVSAGLCRHVVVFRTVWEGTAQGSGGRASITSRQVPNSGATADRVSGFMQWMAPFGAPSAVCWAAMSASRHFAEYGTTREQLAWLPLTCRAHASLNPSAIYRTPLTLSEYLNARMISEPLGLYDCDVPVDGSTALIVSHVDSAPDLRRRPVRIEAVGTAMRGRPFRDQWADYTTMGLRDAAQMLWDRTDLRPADVDIAELYDGFSIIALNWLEALGFCGPGEGGPFIDGGSRIALTGDLPLNTHGGQLSAGRLHGLGFVHEACVQLRREGGHRQVPGDPEVAVVSNGGPTGGTLLLTSWR
jgi:acetyl-CoA acetyltransferase